MIKQYHPSASFSDFVDYGNHQRSAVIALTDNLDYVSEVQKKGWTVECVKNKLYRLKAPEISILDISDPFSVSDPVINFHFFTYLKTMIESGYFYKLVNDIIAKHNKYHDLEWLISSGPSMETEIRLIGSDSRINQLVKEILFLIKRTNRWKSILESIA